MPFENLPIAPLKIAIIGGGVSGLGAAYGLSPNHNVTIFENENRLGGHARTILSGKNGDQPVDTGFIVFNYANYPRLTQMFDELDVPVIKSDMSFGVSANNGQVEYALTSLGSLFAQKRNLINPAFLGMLRDIHRFNKNALALANDPNLTLAQLLETMGMGDWFKKYYLLPFSGAIWSTPINEMMQFPAMSLLRFFDNHNLLGITGQHQWYTVDGGSIEYVNRISSALTRNNVRICLRAPVQGVRRDIHGVHVRTMAGDWEQFDRVIFACHSDDALKMLSDPTGAEKAILGDLTYQDNRAVLHCDPSVMPRRKNCWASWVYSTKSPQDDAPIGVTYWMNSLQNIPHDDLLLETLNPSQEIRDDLIYEETNFRHPVFDRAALIAQEKLKKIQGDNNTWYCGAYTRSGFHEDGFASGIELAETFPAMGELV